MKTKPHAMCSLKAVSFLMALTMIFLVNTASGETHLSVKVADPSAFRNYFWIDGTFGGLLSDFIELPDGTYNIQVFGPPGTQASPNDRRFYTLRIEIKVINSVPKIQSVTPDSICLDEGVQLHVKEVPTPLITKNSSNSYTLEIKTPILVKAETECEVYRDSIASWANIGILKLITTSTPAGAEVRVGGEVIGKTNSAINVPYRDENIDVVIRMPGSVNCKWSLKGPFKEDVRLNCVGKRP